MGLFGTKKHSIGKTIAEFRKEKGWTQIELAEKLQVSDKAISKWEKDNGAPSVEFFPALAELFGVSIDYIMTGKKPEPEIVNISRLELSAKNDDLELYKSLKVSTDYTDENRNTIYDYVFKYESKEIFKFLLSQNRDSLPYNGRNDNERISFCKNWYYMRLLCNDETIVRDFIRLEYCNSTINLYLGANSKDIKYNGKGLSVVPRKIISDRMIDYILYSKDISSALRESLLSNYKEISNNFYSPAFSYPYFIEYAVKKNDLKTAKQLLEKAKDFNTANSGLDIFTYDPINVFIRYIIVPLSAFNVMLDKEAYEIINLANEVNTVCLKNPCYKDIAIVQKKDIAIIDSYIIEANKVKHSKKLSETEKTVQSCIHYGILNIDELLATKNLDLIKQALNDYPIHPIEILYDWYKNKNWKKLFEYAVNNNLNLLADSIIKIDNDKIKIELANVYKKNLTSQSYSVNKDKSFTVRNDAANTCMGDISQIIGNILAYKKQVISDLSYELDKEKTIGDLTKKYFEAELAKGNAEMVIVKLCVRLEAILRSTYHYEGDFSEMLTDYCTNKCQNDVVANYLHKLRKCRNGIVHSEKTDERMTLDELKFCIDYICNLG